MNYTIPELESLLHDLESDLVERKQSFSDSVALKVREAICAYCNDLPHYNKAGVIFIGPKDNGKPSGLTIDDALLSPGGPFGIVNATNFGEPGVTDYRNPNIAEAMKNLGFVQRFGVGIQIARARLKENGNPP